MHLNEDTAIHNTNINDESGQGNNGILKTADANTNKSSNGMLNKSLFFDGINNANGDIIVGPSSNNITGDNLQTITMAAWIKTTSTSSQYIMSLKRSSSNSSLFSITSNNGGAGNLGIITRNHADTSHSYLNHNGSYNDGSWHYVACVIDGLTRNLYVDGLLVASDSAGMAEVTNNTKEFTVGGFAEGYGSLQFAGNIDELSVWRRALSAIEIADIYKRGALKLRYQLRSCNDSLCDTEQFIGPDGTNASYYSELSNLSVNTAFLAVTNLSANRFFQYKVYLDTSDLNYSPELKSVSIGPSHYFADNPDIFNKTGESFTKLIDFAETLGAGNEGTIKYQISHNGTDWYYYNGLNWVNGTGFAQSNTAAELNSNIAKFPDDINSGDFYFKAFLHSENGTESIELNNIAVTLSTESYNNGEYYVSTLNNSQLDTNSWETINSISFDETTTGATSIGYLLSFDNRGTWKYWDGASWQTAIDTNIGQSLADNNAFINANNSIELEALSSIDWSAVGGFQSGTTSGLDFAMNMGTNNTNFTPSLNQITINYDEKPIWRLINGDANFPIDIITDELIRITNNNGAREELILYVR